MALNPVLTQRVREALSGENHVEEKKMFRGIAFMVNGKMCVTVGDNRLMLRIDPCTHLEATAQAGVSTVKMKGREYTGWIYVNESVIPDKRKLSYWVKKALRYNAMIK